MLAIGTASAQPSCDPTAVLGLSSALGVTLAGITAAALYAFRDRCTRGDSQRVYDTPCPYCETKQPKNCIREHLTECEEHRKYWVPRIRGGMSLKYTRPPRLSIPVVSPPKPVSIVLSVPQSVSPL